MRLEEKTGLCSCLHWQGRLPSFCVWLLTLRVWGTEWPSREISPVSKEVRTSPLDEICSYSVHVLCLSRWDSVASLTPSLDQCSQISVIIPPKLSKLLLAPQSSLGHPLSAWHPHPSLHSSPPKPPACGLLDIFQSFPNEHCRITAN